MLFMIIEGTCAYLMGGTIDTDGLFRTRMTRLHGHFMLRILELHRRIGTLVPPQPEIRRWQFEPSPTMVNAEQFPTSHHTGQPGISETLPEKRVSSSPATQYGTDESKSSGIIEQNVTTTS